MDLPASPRVLQMALDEACRRSFYHFVLRFYPLVGSGDLQPNWHHKLLAHEFEEVFHRRQRRTIVAIAPRSLKSIIASVLFPAWVLGRDPTRQFYCASYSMDLASKHARDCRLVMRDPDYRRIFPATVLDPAKQSEQEFTTTAGGVRRAISVGGTFTGLGGDHIICDDLMNAQEASSKAARDRTGEWMDGVMRSRLNNPMTGTISIIAQRLHQDDPIGRILQREGDGWRLIELPAIAETRQSFDLGRGEVHVREPDEVLEPGRMPLSFLEEQKRVIGTANFSAQYQQRPTPEKGNLVLREWFQNYDFDPRNLPGVKVFQSWDMAMKAEEANDYSVCITIAVDKADYRRGDIYIMNVFRKKLIYPDLKKAVLAMSRDWLPLQVVIEDKGTGTGLIQDLKREGVVRPIAYVPKGDKVTRLSLQSAKIEQGRVFLPLRLQWAQEFLAEVIGFPNMAHDDQVDALTQVLDYLDLKARRSMSVGREGPDGVVIWS